MANLLDYIEWRGDLSFFQSEFNNLDALVFSQISYLNFKNLITSEFSKKKSISLYELSEKFFKTPDLESRSDLGMLINSKTSEFFKKVSCSNRFKNVRVCAFCEELNEIEEKQFAAMTFILPEIGFEKSFCVTFRGTDDSIAGWKEDFNISFLDAIPSQICALEYLEKASKSLKGKIYVSGHSKGGCECVYSAVKCNSSVKKRISGIFNFDGPGFSEEFFDSNEFLNVENKISNFYPECSVVGMIFNHGKKYKIVKSSEFLVMQHDALSWQVSGKKFEEADEFSSESQFFYKTFNEWLSKIDKNKRKDFVDALFSILYATGAKTNSEIAKGGVHSSSKMFKAFSELDGEKKDNVKQLLGMLIRVGRENTPFYSVLNEFKKDEKKEKSSKEKFIEFKDLMELRTIKELKKIRESKKKDNLLPEEK